MRRPLPAILRETIIDPIGASKTWHWQGYHNSWVDIDGVMMQSVSGGGHFGGGCGGPTAQGRYPDNHQKYFMQMDSVEIILL